VEPVLLGSFTEFERRYGGLERLQTDVGERIPYTAHAARAFFMNGGRRLYIARVFAPRGAAPNEDWGVASRTIVTPAGNAVWHARWPGAFGNVRVQSLLRRSGNIAATTPTPSYRATWRFSRSIRTPRRTPSGGAEPTWCPVRTT
jgi:hypothetical protein